MRIRWKRLIKRKKGIAIIVLLCLIVAVTAVGLIRSCVKKNHSERIDSEVTGQEKTDEPVSEEADDVTQEEQEKTEPGDREVTEVEVESEELSEEEVEEIQEQIEHSEKPRSTSPYYVRVNRLANCVTIYAKDDSGAYTIPVKAMICSVGKDINDTPTGVFATYAKYTWRYLFGEQYGQYTTRIVGHILFHSVPYTKPQKDMLKTDYYNNLGVGDSMGCIRLTVADAKWIYDNCPLGTTVEIYDDVNPGPLGKPGAIRIDPASPYAGWDPTDPDPANPWLSVGRTPVLSGVRDITVERGNSVSLSAHVSATDFCGNLLSVSVSGSVDFNNCGQYPLTYTATDNLGNSASASAVVTVKDTTAPQISQVKELVVSDTTANLADLLKSALSATDFGQSLDASRIVADIQPLERARANHAYGTVYCNAYAVDASGNQSQVLQVKVSYIFKDVTAPVITLKDSPQITVDVRSLTGDEERKTKILEAAAAKVKEQTCFSVSDDATPAEKLKFTYEADGSALDLTAENISVAVKVSATDEAGNTAVATVTVYVSLTEPSAPEPTSGSGSENGIRVGAYNNSVAVPSSVNYAYKDNLNIESQIVLRGNTFINITDEYGAELAETFYTIDSEGKLTLKKEHLDTLAIGKHTYTIWLYPEGITSGDTKISCTFSVNVTMRKLTVTGVRAADKEYDGTDKVDIEEVFLDGIIGNDDVKVDVNWFRGSVGTAEIGDYEEVTLPSAFLIGEDSENYYLQSGSDPVPVNGGVSIKKAKPVIYVDKEKIEKQFGDIDFVPGVTDTNVEAEVVWSVTQGKDIVSISDGTVHILKAGKAVIRLTLPENDHYYPAEDKTITVTVSKKAAPQIPTVEKLCLTYKEETEYTDLKALLPEDCGEVLEYLTPASEGPVVYGQDPQVDKNGILTYTPDADSIEGSETITVKIRTENYENITIKILVTFIKKYAVQLKTGTAINLDKNELTYGETLDGLGFASAVFTDSSGKEVKGKLSWKNPQEKPEAGTTSADWIFTPNVSDYETVSGKAAIVVKKATPTVVLQPQVADRIYYPGKPLVSADLTGGTVRNSDNGVMYGTWKWEKEDVVPTVLNEGYMAVFVPEDQKNYENVFVRIAVKVEKATPYVCIVPAASALTYGDSLEKALLRNGTAEYSATDKTGIPGTFAWKNPEIKPYVSDSNRTFFEIIFTPDDIQNYNVSEAKMILTIYKAAQAPGMPERICNVPYNRKTVGDIALPDGWNWQESDVNKSLQPGIALSVTAVYIGEDKGNYEKESVTVTVTRKVCEHTGGKATCTKQAICDLCQEPYGEVDITNHGEKIVYGEQPPTCISEGYTGVTYCKDCEARLKESTRIPPKGHKWDNGTRIKRPTTEEKGRVRYHCRNCQVTMEEELEKLTEGTITGDVNGDGKVTAEDALAVLKAAAGMSTLTAKQVQAANVNEDMLVNARDALRILKYVAGIVKSFA